MVVNPIDVLGCRSCVQPQGEREGEGERERERVIAERWLVQPLHSALGALSSEVGSPGAHETRVPFGPAQVENRNGKLSAKT